MKRLSTSESTDAISRALVALARTRHRWFRMMWDHTALAVHLEGQLDEMGYALVRKAG